MRTHAIIRSRRGRQRRGAIAVLAAFFLVALLGMAGMLLSLSYLELAEAEMQMATDAAARSAVIEMVKSQSEDTARAKAADIAGRHQVAGAPFTISEANVAFGNAVRLFDGSFDFTDGMTPVNAARVATEKSGSSPAGALHAPFAFSAMEASAVAGSMTLDYDICLVIDRSASLAWDLTGNQFQYPGDMASRPILENYFTPPHASGSRWAILTEGLGEFLNILDDRSVPARVGLVTFAEDYTFGKYSATQVKLESDLVENYTLIRSKMTEIGETPLTGGTNIQSGLDEAYTLLTTSANARCLTAQGTIILFSDGIFTHGTDPITVAQQYYESDGIVIHSVTFGADVEGRATMDTIAEVAGNGFSLHADTADELIESFRMIANSLPVLITE
jgi:hypothetical protein